MVWPTLGSRTAKEQNRTETCVCVCVCVRVSVYRVFVYMLVTIVSSAHTHEPTEMSFVVWARPRNHVFSGGGDPPRERALLGVIHEHTQNCPQSIYSPLFARGKERCGIGQSGYQFTVATCYNTNHTEWHFSKMYSELSRQSSMQGAATDVCMHQIRRRRLYSRYVELYSFMPLYTLFVGNQKLT